MQESESRFREQGLKVAAISYDSPAVLREFAARKGIRFPLLSDPESKMIRAFGILNETVKAGAAEYGIPYPGTFIVDPSGIVKAKFFEEDYRERYTAGDILVRQFGAQAGAARTDVETRHLQLTSSASAGIARWGQRIALVLDVTLKPQMHVYAPGVEGGYIPIEWKLEASDAWKAHEIRYPASLKLRLPVIDETVPVYEGRIRLTRDVTVGPDAKLKPALNAAGELVIHGSFRYQACDDKICYNPQTVPLEWKLKVAEVDRQRAAEPLRRTRKP